MLPKTAVSAALSLARSGPRTPPSSARNQKRRIPRKEGARSSGKPRGSNPAKNSGVTISISTQTLEQPFMQKLYTLHERRPSNGQYLRRKGERFEVSLRLSLAMKHKKKPKLPRQRWGLKPFDRIHVGKKGYNRQRDKRAVERRALLGEWEGSWDAR